MGDLDDYLTEIGGLTDIADTSTFSDDTNDQETNNDSGQQQELTNESADQQADQSSQPPKDQAQQNNDGQDQQQKDKGQDQQSQKTAQDHKPVSRHGSGNFLDKFGNIVTQDGKIIAKSGRERRDFERFAKLAGDHNQAAHQIRQYKQQLEEIQFLNNIPRQYNLSNDEVAQGLEIARRMKAGDILGIARDFVALAASKGVNISQIVGEKAGDAIDMVALRAMLDERLAPITQGQRQEAQVSEVEQIARRNYEQFISDNEYADIHGDVIAAIAQRDGISIQQAYNRTRDFAIRNGFDFSNPLGPQIEAAVARQQQQQQQPNNKQDSRPLPSSSASTRNNGVQPPVQTYADPNDDWATIIRRAMNSN